jgi:sec-independent protein translocase protein TatA
MRIFGLGPTELIVILVIVLILFGPKRLPQLGKSLGKTMKSIRDGVEGTDEDDVLDETPSKKKAASVADDDEA